MNTASATSARQRVVEAARILDNNQSVAADVFACPWTSPEQRIVQANNVRLSEALFNVAVREYLRRLQH